jgi:hypothetical protein
LLLAAGGRADILGTPGRIAIVSSGYSGPGGFSGECVGSAASGGSADLWPGVMGQPIAMPVRTLALCPSQVPRHEEGNREDEDRQEDFYQHANSRPVDGRGHVRAAAHGAISVLPGYSRIDALSLREQREPTRRRNRHGTPSRQPVLCAAA